MACHEPVCPGNGNCFGRGFCNGTYETPRCEDCVKGWMGRDCNTVCEHGLQVCSSKRFKTLKFSHEKTCLQGFAPGIIIAQNSLFKLGDLLEACNFVIFM